MASDKPIFISHAPADAAAARRIADALQESGIEAQLEGKNASELKAEIEASALFLAVVSANAGADEKGDFRYEWEVASAHMDTLPRGVPFLLPIIIDDTDEYGIPAPDAFGGVHWIRQPDGETSPDLIEEVVRLLTIPRGPVYFPPIPPGLSRPPFSLKKKSKPDDEKVMPMWLKATIGGVAAVLLVMLGALFFGGDAASPAVAGQTPEAAAGTASTTEVVPEDPAAQPTPVVEKPKPETFSDEELRTAYRSSRAVREYEDAFTFLSELAGRQTFPSLTLQYELARAELSFRLDSEAYINRIQAIVEKQISQTEGWMPPLEYGMKRDFANQRRAIRAGAGALHTTFQGTGYRTEVALTESYMDQGNWALARHYSNQANSALGEILNSATVGPLVSGRFQAFLLMANNDPAAISQLDQLIGDYVEGAEVLESMLIRTLVYQEDYDRAMDMVETTLAKPSALDPATVLFYPPFEQLHDHPRFREVMLKYATAEQIDRAITWVAQQ